MSLSRAQVLSRALQSGRKENQFGGQKIRFSASCCVLAKVGVEFTNILEAANTVSNSSTMVRTTLHMHANIKKMQLCCCFIALQPF